MQALLAAWVFPPPSVQSFAAALSGGLIEVLLAALQACYCHCGVECAGVIRGGVGAPMYWPQAVGLADVQLTLLWQMLSLDCCDMLSRL